MGESRPEYSEDLKRAVYALRAQGLSFLEIGAQIKRDFDGLVLPPRTAQNWCLARKDLIAQLRETVIAQATERAQAVTPALFDRIEDAARDNGREGRGCLVARDHQPDPTPRGHGHRGVEPGARCAGRAHGAARAARCPA